MMTSTPGRLFYRAPPLAEGRPTLELVGEGEAGPRFPFQGQLEVGRYVPAREREEGVLLVEDPTVSYHHCLLRQDQDGRCFVRDRSRNGTRLDGRRLVPNLDFQMHPGQTLSVGAHGFVLQGDPPGSADEVPAGGTDDASDVAEVTVLVGDVRGYTTLVHSVPVADLQPALTRVFEIIEQAIVAHEGIVKEYAGDAVFAFWEHGPGIGGAADACRCVLALDRLVRVLAEERAAWPFAEFPLGIDFALTTGLVAFQRVGSQVPTALSMIGELVPLAFRLEKLATDETGSVLVCNRTHELARGEFEFRDLGDMRAEGWDEPTRVYSLIGERPPDGGTR